MSIDHIEHVTKGIDTIEHVEKFNPYHGKDGRFSSANGAASFTYAPGKSKAHDMAIAREKERQAAAGGGTNSEQKGTDNKAKAEESYKEFKGVVQSTISSGKALTSNDTKKAAKALDKMPEGSTITMRHQNQWHDQRTEYTSKGKGKWQENFIVNGENVWNNPTTSDMMASNILGEIGGGNSISSLSFKGPSGMKKSIDSIDHAGK